MKKGLFVLAIIFACKIFVAWIIPPVGDEAYYWVWSKFLQLCYFDHPGMIAWLFSFSTNLTNSLWRLPFVIVSFLTILCWSFISKNKIKNQNLFLLTLAVSPLVGFGSFIATPDVPLMLFWSLSFLFLNRILYKQSLLDYAGLGTALGLGFCSKYHIVLFVLALLVFLFFEAAWKKIRPLGFLLTIFCGLLFSFPIFLWNFKNDFISFKFQINHGLGQEQWDPSWTLEYILGQLALAIPFVFYKPLWKKFNPATKSKSEIMSESLVISEPDPTRLNVYFALTPLLFFLVSSFKGQTEMNWPLMSFPHLLFLFFSQEKSKSSERLAIGFLYFWLSVEVLFVFCSLNPQYNFLHGKLNEPKRFVSSSEVFQGKRPLFTSTYQSASLIWFHSKVPTFKLRGQSRYDFFDTLVGSTPLTTEFYYLKEDYQELPESFQGLKLNFREDSKPFSGYTLYRAEVMQ